jgi:hypothetical protein
VEGRAAPGWDRIARFCSAWDDPTREGATTG